MSSMVSTLFERFQSWKGRVIAYGGGSGVSVFSNEVAAKASEATDVVVSSQSVTLANLISLGGLIVIAVRLAFDIYVHFDKKKARREAVEDGA